MVDLGLYEKLDLFSRAKFLDYVARRFTHLATSIARPAWESIRRYPSNFLCKTDSHLCYFHSKTHVNRLDLSHAQKRRAFQNPSLTPSCRRHHRCSSRLAQLTRCSI